MKSYKYHACICVKPKINTAGNGNCKYLMTIDTLILSYNVAQALVAKGMMLKTNAHEKGLNTGPLYICNVLFKNLHRWWNARQKLGCGSVSKL